MATQLGFDRSIVGRLTELPSNASAQILPRSTPSAVQRSIVAAHKGGPTDKSLAITSAPILIHINTLIPGIRTMLRANGGCARDAWVAMEARAAKRSRYRESSPAAMTRGQHALTLGSVFPTCHLTLGVTAKLLEVSPS